ncbi:hypothetical protein CH063_14946, partial [Colletotrichum higginsianum]
TNKRASSPLSNSQPFQSPFITPDIIPAFFIWINTVRKAYGSQTSGLLLDPSHGWARTAEESLPLAPQVDCRQLPRAPRTPGKQEKGKRKRTVLGQPKVSTLFFVNWCRLNLRQGACKGYVCFSWVRTM